MKDLHSMLANGNLTPRERFILLIQNDIRHALTGKEVLTPADKVSLEHWKAHTTAEAREWNQLNEGWRYSGRMGLETELYFNDAQAAHLQTRHIIMELIKYPLQREIRQMVEGIKSVKKVSAPQAMEIVSKQRAAKLREGMDVDYAVYQLAFERMSAKDRARLVELYEDVTTDHQYLDQEEVIANLLGGKEILTVAAKKTLANLIAERSYNAFAKQHQLYHYFACIPLAEVMRHFLNIKEISVGGTPLAQNQEADDEDETTAEQLLRAAQEYAREHNTTIEDMLKEGFIDWYDTEGFVYCPLIVSSDKKLFKRWLKAKTDARAELQKLIDTGVLQLCAHAETETHKAKLDHVITGESLYAFDTDLEFVKDFKKRVDEYDPNLGLVYADDDPEKTGHHLDQELLICSTNSTGEPDILSRYGMSLRFLERALENVVFLKEERKGGKNYITFKNKGVEKMFRQSRDSFIDGYAKLLAHKELLRKLAVIYEADVGFRVDTLLARLDGFIETHNDALRDAQGPVRYKHTRTMDEGKMLAEVDPSLFIDKNAILPDQSVIAEHTQKLKEIFYDFA